MPRFFVDAPLLAGATLDLPDGAARHVQVLRLQPGADIVLFDGQGGEWDARVEHMGRQKVQVRLDMFRAVERELSRPVTLALGMPANERMDHLIEKATELGVHAIQPLHCARSVLRLSGERADKKRAHWTGVARAASEQCGRTRVPDIAPVRNLTDWLASLAVDGPAADATSQPPRRWVLSPGATVAAAATDLPAAGLICLSGPEGGLDASEQAAAVAAGFSAVSLGPRILRADTAPLAVLAHLALLHA